MALVLLVFGVSASALTAGSLREATDRHLADATDRRAEAVQQAVATETGRYEDTLRHMATAIAVTPELTSADFGTLIGSLTQEGLPGASGVALVVPVKPGRVAAAQRLWRARGSTGLTLHPATGVPEHRFGVLSRPLDGSQGTATRVDQAPLAEINEAMDRSRLTGTIAASRTYVLRRDKRLPAVRQQQSFVLVAPIFSTGPGTAEARFQGWLAMGMRSRDFLDQALRDVAQGAVNITLSDITDDRDEPVASLRSGPPLDHPGLSRTARVAVGQRVWALQLYPTAAVLPGGPTRQPKAALASGLLISVLLAGLVLSLVTSHDVAVTKVEQATKALRDDIEERKEIETELRHRESELQGFAAVAAHDLKSPLASVTAYAELLRTDHGHVLTEDGLEDVRRIQESAYRMQTLIDDLLSYATARDARLKLEEVDLERVAADIAAERRAYPTESAPEIRVGTLPTVVADPGMMRQLIDNLIGNACKYVHLGSVAQVDVTATRIDGEWRIEVADQGIGIPAEQRATVFGSFTRAKGSERYPGTGLGLAICQRIVERHHGSIGAEDNPAGGSRFYFTLPEDLTRRPAPATDPALYSA
jgi:signal transduction histidine kinase